MTKPTKEKEPKPTTPKPIKPIDAPETNTVSNPNNDPPPPPGTKGN